MLSEVGVGPACFGAIARSQEQLSEMSEPQL